jgi:phosphoglycerate kinase
MDKQQNITDDMRIQSTLPTIRYLTDRGSKVILVSHLGRPKGIDAGLRMDPIAKRLEDLLGQKVVKVDDCVGPEVEAAISTLADGEVMMLENVRFHPVEEKNDAEFSKRLAAIADVYVNDAFGTAHRAHASTEGVARILPGVCGLLIQKELEIMGKSLDDPRRPFVAIIGGAKVSTKITVIRNLAQKVDAILIGGGNDLHLPEGPGNRGREIPCGGEVHRPGQGDMGGAQGDGPSEARGPVDAVVAPEIAAGAPSKWFPSTGSRRT